MASKQWTIDDIKKHARDWNLQGDSQLLELMKSISDNICHRANVTATNIHKLFVSVEKSQIAFENASNKMCVLSKTQFVENRVSEDDNKPFKGHLQVQQEENKLYNPSKTIKKILENNMKMLENCYERVSVDLNDSDDDEELEQPNTFYCPKDFFGYRLPRLIGSKDWIEKWHVGLLDSDEEESSENAHVNVDEYSDESAENVSLPSMGPTISESGSSVWSINRNAMPISNSQKQRLNYVPSSDEDVRSSNTPVSILSSDETKKIRQSNLSENEIDEPKYYVHKSQIPKSNISSESEEEKINKSRKTNHKQQETEKEKFSEAANIFSDEPPELDIDDINFRKPVDNKFSYVGEGKQTSTDQVHNLRKQSDPNSNEIMKKPVIMLDNDFDSFMKELNQKTTNKIIFKNPSKKVNLFISDSDDESSSKEINAQHVFKENTSTTEEVMKKEEATINQIEKSADNEKNLQWNAENILSKKGMQLFDDDFDDTDDIFASINSKLKTNTQFSNTSLFTKTKISNLFDDEPPEDDFDNIFQSSKLKSSQKDTGVQNLFSTTGENNLYSVLESLPNESKENSELLVNATSSLEEEKSSLSKDNLESENKKIAEPKSSKLNLLSTDWSGNDEHIFNRSGANFERNNSADQILNICKNDSSIFIASKNNENFETNSSNNSGKILSAVVTNSDNAGENIKSYIEKPEIKIQASLEKNLQEKDEIGGPHNEIISKNSHQIEPHSIVSTNIVSIQTNFETNSKNDLDNNSLFMKVHDELYINQNDQIALDKNAKNDNFYSMIKPTEKKEIEIETEKIKDSNQNLTVSDSFSSATDNFSFKSNEKKSSANEEFVTNEKNFQSHQNIGLFFDQPPDDIQNDNKKISENLFNDDFDRNSENDAEIQNNHSNYIINEEPPPDNFFENNPNKILSFDGMNINEEGSLRHKNDNENEGEEILEGNQSSQSSVQERLMEGESNLGFDDSLKLSKKENLNFTTKIVSDDIDSVSKLANNLNINVSALLPGAKPSKMKSNLYAEAKEKEILNEVHNSNISVNANEITREGKLIGLNKSRAKIMVKRKPSTRQGRQESYRKSRIINEDLIDSKDWLDHTIMNSESGNGKIEDLTKIFPESKSEIQFSKKNTHSIQNVSNQSNQLTDSLFSDFDENDEGNSNWLPQVSSTIIETLSKKTVPNKDIVSFGTSPPFTPNKNILVKTDILNQFEENIKSKKSKIDIFDNEDDDLFASPFVKVVSSTIVKQNLVSKNIDSKEESIFRNFDAERDEIFKKVKIKKSNLPSEKNTKNSEILREKSFNSAKIKTGDLFHKSKSLFSSDEDEEDDKLFNTSKGNKNLKKINENMKSKLHVKTSKKNSDSLFDDLGDDDEDDLFGTSKVTAPKKVNQPVNTSRGAIPKQRPLQKKKIVKITDSDNPLADLL